MVSTPVRIHDYIEVPRSKLPLMRSLLRFNFDKNTGNPLPLKQTLNIAENVYRIVYGGFFIPTAKPPLTEYVFGAGKYFLILLDVHVSRDMGIHNIAGKAAPKTNQAKRQGSLPLCGIISCVQSWKAGAFGEQNVDHNKSG